MTLHLTKNISADVEACATVGPGQWRVLLRKPSRKLSLWLLGKGLSIYYVIRDGGGVSRDPKFVLRNIWTAPYKDIKHQNLNTVRTSLKTKLLKSRSGRYNA